MAEDKISKDKISKISRSLKDLTSASDASVSAIKEVNDAVLKSGDAMDGLLDSLKKVGVGLDKLGSGMGGLIGSVPLLGSVGTALSGLGDISRMVTDAVGTLGEGFMNTIRVTDQFSAVNRSLTMDNFKLAAQFGQSLNEAENFTKFMLTSSESLAQADFGYQNFATESKEMVKALSNQRLSFDKMQDVIKTTEGNFNLYSMAVLQSNALGLEFSEYASLMSDAIMKQGMTTQEAAETLSIYGEMAGKTGLTVKTIADSLNGLGNSFRKMGLDAGFGQSFLMGFASTLKETSIGIENAADLASTFGSALANLTTNYSSAYLTAMKGGLDMGSGGALGAGIQMQAKLLNPDTDQAAFGEEIAGALKETLSSLTGGRIVTVQEAAASKDPRLEQIYYTQTQLLQSLYGISDSSDQARTLELLQQMSQAQASGDRNGMAAIGADLKEAMGLREETLSNEEKLNAIATSQLAQLATQTQILSTGFAMLAQENLVDFAGTTLTEAISQFTGLLPEASAEMEGYIQKVRRGEVDSLTEAYAGEKPTNAVVKALSEAEMPKMPDEDDMSKGLMSALKESTLSVQDTGLAAAFKELATKIGELAAKVSNGGSTNSPGAHVQ